jgi:CcmD family protein
MSALVAAYVAVWVGVSLYVVWLGVRQSQLDARLHALESQSEQYATTNSSIAEAA